MAEYKSFQQYLDSLAPKEEVANYIKQLTEFVKECKKKLEEAYKKFTQETDAKISALEAKIGDTEGRVSQRQDSDKESMYSESRTLQRLLEQKEAEIIARIPNPTDLSPYEQKLLDLEGRIPNLPEELSREGIRDKLETFDEEDDKLRISAIGYLEERLKKLESRVGKGGISGSGGGISISHVPTHETFTMDGVATTVTLSQGVGAGGNAIIAVRYQGQVLDFGEDYTVSGNLITFVDFLPEADTIISVTYIP